jgi:hypothetical protein
MAKTVQKTINAGNSPCPVACSHVRAPYPQAGPQFPGASGKAASRYPQGFAGRFESFFLDPEASAV